MKIMPKRTLSIMISVAIISLFAVIYFAVNAAPGDPIITSANNYSCIAGEGGQFPLTAVASNTNIKWSLSGQPAGVAVATNSNLLIVANTVPEGIYPFVVKAENNAATTQQSFTLSVTSSSASPGLGAGYYANTYTSAPYVQTVRFNSKGGSAVATQYITPGGKVKEPEEPLKKKFEFGGWYLELTFKTEYDFDLAVNSDLTLYAKWTDGTEEKDEPEDADEDAEEDEEDDDETDEYESLFADVFETDWFSEAVAYVGGEGLMIGMDNGLFGPEINVSRAMIVTVLYRFAGEPDAEDLPLPFYDVDEDAWYADAVKWAVSEGIVFGYEDFSFGPDDLLTKQQLATIIYRTQQATGLIPNDILMDKQWPDWDEIDDWAKNPVNVLTIQGLFRDIPGVYFNPKAPASRAEIASILYRYLTSVE
jgi:uncharacterized repeat protein (TIGR02543 family)